MANNKKRKKAVEKKRVAQRNKKNPSSNSQTAKRSIGSMIGIGLIVVAFLGTLILPNFLSKPTPDDGLRTGNVEPQFEKEGELTFLLADNTTKKIDIEIADNEGAIMQGLMFRKSMNEDRGMLFLMPVEEEQSFWMRNTLISLDIIYINSALEIVSIQRNTTPGSEKSLPSYGNALYVLEVNAGFCKKFGIGKGDKIEFQRE